MKCSGVITGLYKHPLFIIQLGHTDVMKTVWLLLSELKIPIRIAATGVGDQEDDTKPTKADADGTEKGPCCPCPKSVEDLEAEAADASYRKVFENFLHNSIFTPRYTCPLFVARACVLQWCLRGDCREKEKSVSVEGWCEQWQASTLLAEGLDLGPFTSPG